METKGTRGRQPPLLLIGYGPYVDQKHCIYNVLENRCDTAVIPVLSDKSVFSCNFGWIVLVNRLTHNCSLWNPESRKIIRLPELPESYLYNQCVLSKPPTEPGCHVLFNSANKCKQAFCQIGEDEFVVMSLANNQDVQRVQTLIFFHGDIYALVGFTMRLMTISFMANTLEFRPILKSGKPWHIFPSLRSWTADEKYYLIADDDEMLLVCKMSPATYLRQFSDFKVFRINISRFKCLELVDIGQRTIFLSNMGDTFCYSSSGVKPNCIYYTRVGRNLYIYNLDKRAIISLLPCPAADRLMSTTWIEHRLSVT